MAVPTRASWPGRFRGRSKARDSFAPWICGRAADVAAVVLAGRLRLWAVIGVFRKVLFHYYITVCDNYIDMVDGRRATSDTFIIIHINSAFCSGSTYSYGVIVLSIQREV